MNQNQIQQLTSHLSQALDQNYDVVNMEAVLSVIVELEGTTITKEQLEATRLAKYINQLRRRTKNEQLARRAKSLLKKWREMVGIQQTTNDSQVQILPIPLQHSLFKPTIASGSSNISESNIAESMANTLQYSPSSQPSQRVVSDLHTNIDSLEPVQLSAAGTQQHPHQHQHNFSSLINHINIENSEESIVSKPIKQQRTTELQKSAIFMNEHSSNSASVNLANVGNDKLISNEASIVIDIVSDSDENDSCIQQHPAKQKLATVPSSILIPVPAIYPRPKKLKKDKKRKERDIRTKPLLSHFKEDISQQSRNVNRSTIKEGKIKKNYPTDSEILSLSNSSMSSILSGDAVSGSSQNKLRTSKADLTFAGRFKSVSQLNSSTQDTDNSVLSNGQKIDYRIKPMETSNANQPIRQIYDNFIVNNDSSTCSRLSPFEEVEAQQGKIQLNAKSLDQGAWRQMNTHLALSISKPHDTSSNKIEYHENILSQGPKKRGRKKGSKGVDSKIAKESSLSQQIFFGSGVKKVKTTKELFNEIQSRKLSISLNRGESLPEAIKITNDTSTTLQCRESRSLLTRPTSSCSETSLHSPQTLETYSASVSLGATDKFSNALEDAGNTDSDTITSEPSRDSIKFGNIKRSTSLDSNSNSIQTLSAKNTEASTPANKKNNDVTTQLMHLVNSLKRPLSVSDTEILYNAQIVPCTCIIVEEMTKLSTGQNNLSPSDNEADDLNRPEGDDQIVRDVIEDNNDNSNLKITCGSAEEATLFIPQKPIKSIFDLDFDDDDDPLHTIIKTIALPDPNVKPITRNNDNDNDNNNDNDVKSTNTVSLLSEFNSIDIQAASGSNQNLNQDQDASDIVVEPISVYTVQEDPNCFARKRFNVQTNDVTNFHINALHNYYVPNINGNWNSIDTSLVLKSTVSEVLKTIDSYTVSDGADVVPKYGSLTYERIRKELTCLKFAKYFKPKSLKSYIPPFLGVAKCLPSCRLAAKRLKEETKQKASSGDMDVDMIAKLQRESETINLTIDLDTFKCNPSPLRVDVDTHNSNDNQVKMHYSGDESYHEVSDSINSKLSYNLLKLANNNADFERQTEDGKENSEQIIGLEIGDLEMDTHKSSRRSSSSSCSNSSLKITNNSVNEIVQNQRSQITTTEQSERNLVERNRKKRRKINSMPRIKRLKIAINGNVATQKHISHISSSNNSSDEHEDNEHEYEGDTQSELSDTEAGYGATTGYYKKERGQTASEDEHESYRSHSTTIDSIAADEDAHLENDNDNENEYDNSNDEEYAIVQRPMLGGGNNHIVLTIKKTPSKINSPVNSISATSPTVVHPSVNVAVAVAFEAETATETVQNTHFTNMNINNNHINNNYYNNNINNNINNNNNNANVHHTESEKLGKFSLKPMSHTCLNSFHRCRFRRRNHSRPRRRNCQPEEIISIEMKHLLNNVTRNNVTQPMVKAHQKLFFTDELCAEDKSGRKERIINYSSSSSSNFDDDSEYEVELSSSDETEQFQIDFANKYKLKIETDTIAAKNYIHQEDSYLSSTTEDYNVDDENTNTVYDTMFAKHDQDEELPLPPHNNGMLPSFNLIHDDHDLPNLLASEVKDKDAAKLETLQIENCDDVNTSICYNFKNLSVIKSNSLDSNSPINNDNNELKCVIYNTSSRVLESNDNDHNLNLNQTPPEYRTGIRPITNDAPSKHDPNASQVQQFKEWHEVLQLQSYNNEPLIVLPYVVLE